LDEGKICRNVHLGLFKMISELKMLSVSFLGQPTCRLISQEF
jgi:hypothetical protein